MSALTITVLVVYAAGGLFCGIGILLNSLRDEGLLKLEHVSMGILIALIWPLCVVLLCPFDWWNPVIIPSKSDDPDTPIPAPTLNLDGTPKRRSARFFRR